MDVQHFKVPYEIDTHFNRKVAYFSMEFAIHQSLKIYSGGLGFLAGSHLRSAYDLKQNFVGIGILWRDGYYDQGRYGDQSMRVAWTEKTYSFLEDTGIKFQINIHDHPIWVKAYYLNPETFGTAPLFLLSTILPENDHLAQTICYKLYDDNASTKLAQCILLGIGGAKLLDEINFNPDIYHLNEAHAVSAAFYLYNKLGSKEAVREKMVFTTHTPEEAGNEKHDIWLCKEMGFFDGLPIEKVNHLVGMEGGLFNHSLAALRFSHLANGVSQLHGEVSRKMWEKYEGVCDIKAITNAQNWRYWADKQLYRAMLDKDEHRFDDRKNFLKRRAMKIVADQAGKLFDPKVLTIVWARRFAGYKRAELLTRDRDRFEKLISNTRYPVQIVWAGKPYPLDHGSVGTFNYLVQMSKQYKNMAVLTGYELALSRRLKQVADVWLNNPRVPREASGTSGMTAAMNGAVNLSTNDGWIREFARNNENSFIVPTPDYDHLSLEQQDQQDLDNLYHIIENEILPTYYKRPEAWRQIVINGMRDVRTRFDSDRMAEEYYEIMYR